LILLLLDVNIRLHDVDLTFISASIGTSKKYRTHRTS